jgi:hypothetical protein
LEQYGHKGYYLCKTAIIFQKMKGKSGGGKGTDLKGRKE